MWSCPDCGAELPEGRWMRDAVICARCGRSWMRERSHIGDEDILVPLQALHHDVFSSDELAELKHQRAAQRKRPR